MEKKKRYNFILIIAVLLYVNNLGAQRVSNEIQGDEERSLKFEVIKPHSPHKASMYSAVLPGLGQAYNGQYWKIPVVYGLIGGVVYAIDWNSKMYNLYKNGYRDFLVQDPANRSYLEILEGSTLEAEDVEGDGDYADWFENTLENGKDYYKKYRDLSYVGLALVYVVNIIDASVFAHFKTFDVSNDLSMRIDPYVQPGMGGNSTMGLQLRIVF